MSIWEVNQQIEGSLSDSLSPLNQQPRILKIFLHWFSAVYIVFFFLLCIVFLCFICSFLLYSQVYKEGGTPKCCSFLWMNKTVKTIGCETLGEMWNSRVSLRGLKLTGALVTSEMKKHDCFIWCWKKFNVKYGYGLYAKNRKEVYIIATYWLKQEERWY